MPGITVVGTPTAQERAAETVTPITIPTGVLAGHVLVGWWGGSNITLATNPSGWTQVANFSRTGSTQIPSMWVGLRVADGSEGSSLSLTHPSGVSICGMIAYAGVDNGTPQDVAASPLDMGATGNVNMVIPALTTTRPGCALVYGTVTNSAVVTMTPPTSPGTFTEISDRVTGTRAGSMGHLIWSGFGTTGTVTVVQSSSIAGIGVLLALRPAIVRPRLHVAEAAIRRASRW